MKRKQPMQPRWAQDLRQCAPSNPSTAYKLPRGSKPRNPQHPDKIANMDPAYLGNCCVGKNGIRGTMLWGDGGGYDDSKGGKFWRCGGCYTPFEDDGFAARIARNKKLAMELRTDIALSKEIEGVVPQDMEASSSQN
mmetsp:Transcript_65941/g.109588  ORF Transcript_65941/g.109588 Transcript_65941/m.109588 type:complete len:137 (+) Transcript_65941:33-443(+)